MGLLIDRSNSNLENINLINEHALNREPVLLSPTSLISPPPPFQGKKVNKPPSPLSPLPLPLIIPYFTVLISHDCKTLCGLICFIHQLASPIDPWLRDLQLLILVVFHCVF